MYLYDDRSPHCFCMRFTSTSLSGRKGMGPHSVGPQDSGYVSQSCGGQHKEIRTSSKQIHTSTHKEIQIHTSTHKEIRTSRKQIHTSTHKEIQIHTITHKEIRTSSKPIHTSTHKSLVSSNQFCGLDDQTICFIIDKR
jgi:hypothetical protein